MGDGKEKKGERGNKRRPAGAERGSAGALLAQDVASKTRFLVAVTSTICSNTPLQIRNAHNPHTPHSPLRHHHDPLITRAHTRSDAALPEPTD
jgi:hypothetical protein